MHPRHDQELKDTIDKALVYLRGGTFEPAEIDNCAKQLMQGRGNGFTYARRILHKLLHDPDEAKKARLTLEPKQFAEVRERYALCTYKDKDLPLDWRLPHALEILQSDGVKLDATASVETLGQAGSIYRQMWEYDLDRLNLHRSYDHYFLGYKKALKEPEQFRAELAWTGINAAYVLDRLAKERTESPSSLLPVGELKKRARSIRQSLIKKLSTVANNEIELRKSEEHRMSSSDLWWLLSTLGQAHYALAEGDSAEQHWTQAKYWLGEAKKLKDEAEIPTWQVEATSKRIVKLARMHEFSEDAKEVLKVFLGEGAPAIHSTARGKIGLALSGGGFRASFFHLGVLARLADLNLLKDVEVISCVSGGSIVGACYYLKLRWLLQEKSDRDLTPEDYVDLIAELCDEFLAGVQENLRTLLLTDLRSNWKILLKKNYTRTDRAGELFEELLFQRVDRYRNTDEWRLKNLVIKPMGLEQDQIFHPRYHNFDRAHKVPMLVLNASTLNTGHNWQFTTSWMGEPPGRIDTEIDANERLRRFYLNVISGNKAGDLTLGRAVAASACVPGIFDPVSFPDLYDKRVVRLVDGGVFDNQGIHALLEEDCEFVLISDASGQMNTENIPGDGALKVPLRANAILMERVREIQFKELDARRKAGLLKVMFVHLKKELAVRPVPWKGCEEPSDNSAVIGRRKQDEDLTDYQINEDNQRLLANIRTDLDVFSEAEAYALMSSGYRMVQHYKQINDFDNDLIRKMTDVSSKNENEVENEVEVWKFLCVTPFLRSADPDSEFRKILKAASSKELRFWRLKYPRILSNIKLVISILLLAGAAIYILIVTLNSVESGRWIQAVIALVAVLVLAWFLHSPKRILNLLLGTFGMLWARLHLRFMNRRYLDLGEIDRAEKSRKGI